jgi:hypothetical protein
MLSGAFTHHSINGHDCAGIYHGDAANIGLSDFVATLQNVHPSWENT